MKPLKYFVYWFIFSGIILINGCGKHDAPETTISEAPPESSSVSPSEILSETPSETIHFEVSSPTIPGRVYLYTTVGFGIDYRDAEIVVESKSGSLERQTIQIKLRGNSSVNAPKQSYNIKFSKKVSLLGMEPEKKWSFLGNPYEKTLLRASLAFDYAAAIGIPYTSQNRICQVWVNDEYVGTCVAVEPVNVKKNRVDINIDAGDFLVERNRNREEVGITYINTDSGMRFEINEPESPDSATVNECLRILNEIETAVQTLDHNIYEDYIDIDSFINFYIFHELVKDIDFGEFSTRYFVKKGKLYAGPPWDFDLSFGNVATDVEEEKFQIYHNIEGFGDASEDSSHGFWAQKDYYKWLCQDDYFMDKVRLRWQYLFPLTENLAWDNELGESWITRQISAYGDILESNYTTDGANWPIDVAFSIFEMQTPASSYSENVTILQQWLKDRITWLDEQFRLQ